MADSKIEEFRVYLIDNERSENTISSYLFAVRQYFSLYPEVSKAGMIGYKQQMMEKYKPKTAALRCTAMNQYCDFLGRPECKTKVVKIHKQVCVENVPTPEEYQYFLDSLKADGDDRTYFLVEFLAKTGARVSEIVRFRKEHLKAGQATIWTKGKIRTILIPASLIEESRGFFQNGSSEWLFPNRYGGQMTTRGISGIIKKSGERYGIRPEILHPHAFRHLYAIQFLKHNKNIALLADLMGHESVDTTSIYLRLSAEEQKKQLDEAMNW